MVRLAPLLFGLGLAAGETLSTTSTTDAASTVTSDVTSSVRTARVLPLLQHERHGGVRFPNQAFQQPQYQVKEQAYPAQPKQGYQATPKPGYQTQPKEGYQSQPKQGYQAQPKHYEAKVKSYPAQQKHDRDSFGGQHHQSGGGGYHEGNDNSYHGGNDNSYQSYSSYETDGYGQDGYSDVQSYSSGGGGGFLGKIGQYSIFLVPILLVIAFFFLFPSVVNVNGGRGLRALIGDPSEPSGDLLSRLGLIYDSISEEPLCKSRMYCELGAAVGKTDYAENILKYVDILFPSSKSRDMQVLRKAASAQDPKCQVLQCAAWKDEQPASATQ